jgi:hypothetical protein
MNYDPKPTKCNLCGGVVIFNQASKDKSASGYVYYCTNCHAWVGTYPHDKEIAYGQLANFETRKKRAELHDWFDRLWRNHDERTMWYQKLANELGIDIEYCHIGMFDEPLCDKALVIVKKWWLEKFDR